MSYTRFVNSLLNYRQAAKPRLPSGVVPKTLLRYTIGRKNGKSDPPSVYHISGMGTIFEKGIKNPQEMVKINPLTQMGHAGGRSTPGPGGEILL